MDKIFHTMMIGIVFQGAAEALRNPEKHDQRTRELMADTLEKFAGSAKQALTGDLMGEAVKDVPQGS